MAGSSNITNDESIIFADNASFDGTERGGKMTTDGQLWIGSTAAPHVRLGTLVAGAGTTIVNGPGTITISSSATGDVQQLEGNTGGPVSPVGGIIDVVTANATVEFAGSGNTLTQNFGLSNLLLGSEGASITSGTLNTSLGNQALLSLTSGSANTAVGVGAGALITSGLQNTLFGAGAGDALTTGNFNVAVGGSALSTIVSEESNTAIGDQSLEVLLSGEQNTALGAQSLASLTAGDLNIGIGFNAGNSYTTTESSNIIVGNVGVIAESNTIRIGTQGSGAGQQNQTHIAGVINTVSGRVVKLTTPGAYPYTALITDYIILVDTSAARTINLMASPVTGTVLVIKDNVGTANTNPITITPNSELIDGEASYTMDSNWGSVTLFFNGTDWRII